MALILYLLLIYYNNHYFLSVITFFLFFFFLDRVRWDVGSPTRQHKDLHYTLSCVILRPFCKLRSLLLIVASSRSSLTSHAFHLTFQDFSWNSAALHSEYTVHVLISGSVSRALCCCPIISFMILSV